MEEGVLALLIGIFGRLADPARRIGAAEELAGFLEAEVVLAFVRDPEIDSFLLAPGFVRTLPNRSEWQEFAVGCARSSPLTRQLPFPIPGRRIPITGIACNGQVVLALGCAAPAPLTEVIRLFPLLAFTLQTEHEIVIQRAQAGLARSVAQQSHLLAEGLDNARRAAQHEITERKKADEAMTRMSEVLKQTNADLLIARDGAVAASRAKDDFLAALSHELRTPLNPVLLVATDSAQNPALSATIRQDFALIAKNVALEARLIDDLLDLTRISRGKMHFEKQPVALDEVIKDTIAMLNADVSEKNIILACDLPAEVPLVLGDPVRLHQVFWNVIKNAIKFTPVGGSVAVSVSLDSDKRRLSTEVRDSGIGLTAAECGQIFETFRQGEHAFKGGAHRFGGLGLGLAISKALTEMHGGTIQASSAGRDCGATFRIELPCLETSGSMDSPSRSPATSPDRSPVTAEAGGLPRKPRLLLVEDHASSREVLALLLRKRGYGVNSVSSAEDAMAFAKENDFDVLITDLGLPGYDGYQLLAELLKTRPGLTAIALSGFGMDHDVTRSHTAGFSSHLIKPVDLKKLEIALLTAFSRAIVPPGKTA